MLLLFLSNAGVDEKKPPMIFVLDNNVINSLKKNTLINFLNKNQTFCSFSNQLQQVFHHNKNDRHRFVLQLISIHHLTMHCTPPVNPSSFQHVEKQGFKRDRRSLLKSNGFKR